MPRLHFIDVNDRDNPVQVWSFPIQLVAQIECN
uniref:Uncharacterized protein MANES_11G163400 n=1 Tax=Rhizophora mucronata TaxID=61149 RepID=A0A2P2JHI2_RHIMU